MTLEERIQAFLNGSPHAVVGASANRNKYGNKVLRAYLQNSRAVFAVNPRADAIEEQVTVATITDLPEPVHGISVITPPKITEKVVEEANINGIKHVWMQPGAESDAAIEYCEKHEINVIGGDACVLVVLGYRERTA